MEKSKKLLTTFFGIPLTLLSVIFISKIFFDSRESLFLSLERMNFSLFAIGVLFFALFFLIKGIVWIEILKRSGHSSISRDTLFDYSFAETKRYVPGSIFGFAARVKNLAPHLSKGQIFKGIGAEAFLFVLSAAVVSLPSLFYFSDKTIQFLKIPQLPFFVFAIIFLVLFSVFLFSKFFKLLKSYFYVFLTLLLGWLFFGIASLFIALSFGFIHPNDYLIVISYFVLSWLIGYLAFIVPMGLGVREVAIVSGLSFFVGVPLATIIALFSRLGMIIGEILQLLMSLWLKRAKETNRFIRIKPVIVILFASIFCFIAYFTFFTFLRHETFRSGRFDLGNMSQTVWNTSRGHIFQLTNPDGTEIISRLGVHADFILVLITPLYYLWADPRTLLILQTVIVGFGAFYVYEIAVTLLKKEKLSLVLAISYLLNFWVQEQVIFDFHAISLATTFLLGAFYYLLVSEKKSFIAFLILALLTKENVYLTSALFGVLLIFKKKYFAGSVLFMISLAVFYLLMSYLIPNARGTTHFALSYLSYLGDSTGEIIKNSITKPYIPLYIFFSFESLKYILFLLMPLGGLSIFSPLLLLATPDVLINTLSSNSGLRSYDHHYGAIIIPFLYISAIYGIKFLDKKFRFSEFFFLCYIILFTVISVYFYSPLPGMENGDIGPFLEDNKKIHEYLSLIPSNATVSASNNIAAHLSHRDYIFVVPRGMDKAEYVVFYNETPDVQSQFYGMNFRLLIHDGNFYLYKRDLTPCLQCKP